MSPRNACIRRRRRFPASAHSPQVIMKLHIDVELGPDEVGLATELLNTLRCVRQSPIPQPGLCPDAGSFRPDCLGANRSPFHRRMLTERVKVRYTQPPPAPAPSSSVASAAAPPPQQLVPQANGALGGVGQHHQQAHQQQQQPRANGATSPHAPLQELPPRPPGPAPTLPPQPQQPPPPQVSIAPPSRLG